jgi:hypothetical protein
MGRALPARRRGLAPLYAPRALARMGKGRIRPRGSGQPYRQPVSVDPESQRPSVVVSSATASIDIDSPHHCGRPRLVTPLARARTAAAVSDEAAAEEWPSGDR